MRMLGFFLTATWEDMKIRVGKGVGIDRRLCFLVWKVALEMIVSLLVTGDMHCRPELISEISSTYMMKLRLWIGDVSVMKSKVTTSEATYNLEISLL
jgi:hypothetical protein